MKTFTIRFTLFFLLLFTGANSTKAQGLFEGYDTIPLENFKLNKAEFLEKYGTDDSLVILINHYFAIRNNGVLLALTMPGAIAVTGIGITADILLFSGTGQGVIFPIFTLLAVSVAVPPARVLGPLGTVIFLTHGRKNLYYIIDGYHNGNGIAKKYRKVLKNKLERKARKANKDAGM